MMIKRNGLFPPLAALLFVLLAAKGVKRYIAEDPGRMSDEMIRQSAASRFALPPAFEQWGLYLSHRTYLLYAAALIAFAGVYLLRARRTQWRRKAYRPVKLTLACTDTLVLLVAFAWLGLPGTHDSGAYASHGATTLYVHLALTLATVGWFWVGLEHYARRRPFCDELREIAQTLGIATMLAGATIFYAGVGAERGATLWTWGCAFATLPLGRSAARALLDGLGLWRQEVLIIGSGDNARDAWPALRSAPGMGYRLLGFVDVSEAGAALAGREGISIGSETYPVFLPSPTLDELLREYEAAQLIVALDDVSCAASQALLQQLTASRRNIHVIPPIRGLPLFGTHLSHFFCHDVLFLTVRNNLTRRSYRWVKRAFDLLVAGSLLIVLSPLFMIVSLAIRRSGGTAFYAQTRVGRDGKPFRCLKFRTMRPDADTVLQTLLASDPQARAEWEQDFKLRSDPRITPIGHFLRKRSIDELPQLINVLRGEMSLVGPRPIVDAELARYGAYVNLYLRVLPGVTGLWQVSGRNDASYAERVSLDAWYVQNWSIWYDIAVLFKTVRVVIQGRGAY